MQLAANVPSQCTKENGLKAASHVISLCTQGAMPYKWSLGSHIERTLARLALTPALLCPLGGWVRPDLVEVAMRQRAYHEGIRGKA